MKLCGFEAGLDQPLFLKAGPCVVESMELQLNTADNLKEITTKLGVNFIFKSSFDKANRTSGDSFRGLGKGQFLSPWEMKPVVEKARSTGNDRIMVCERGASFGYNNLVNDMRSLAVLRETGCPIVFDATHSMQQPGWLGSSTGEQREFEPVLARAAVAVGVSGIFIETHPDPPKALSDGPNSWPLDGMEELLEHLMDLDASTKRRGFSLW